MNKIIQHLKENWIRHGFETAVVTIGILAAFGLNNWNEIRKERIIERELYKNLLTSLRKDSIELERIIKLQANSYQGILLIIEKDNYSYFSDSITLVELNTLIDNINAGGNSFFPKLGAYERLVSDLGINIIESDEIKSELIEVYDYMYKRYENIDAVLDHKFAYGVNSVIAKRLKRVVAFDVNTFEGRAINSVTIEDFNEGYLALVEESRDISAWISVSYNLLIEIQSSVHSLIKMIDEELIK